MRHIVICGLPCSTIFFPTLSHKKHDFREKKLQNTKCMFWFPPQYLCDKFLHLKRMERVMIENVCSSSYKVCFNFVRFQWKLKFSRQIFEKYSNIKFHENPCSESWVVLCGQTDGRKDMTKLIVAFRKFCERASFFENDEWKQHGSSQYSEARRLCGLCVM